MNKPALIPVIIFMLVVSAATAQVSDSAALKTDSIAREKALRKKLYSGPRKATIMSAVLPGLGQIYNKKYWKVPIIYAGIGGFGFMFFKNNSLYQDFRKGVIAANDNNPNTDYDHNYSPDQLQVQKLYYLKRRNLAVIGLSIFYIINIIDANVDAHLKTFDVSDNLSMNVRPWLNVQPMGSALGAGMGLSVNFKLK